jgi:hypothetical protein
MAVPGITREHPNFRTAPSLDSTVIRVLSPGTELTVLDRQGDYFRVVVDGQEGFVHFEYVLPNPGGPVAEPPPPAAAAPVTVSPNSLAADEQLAAVPLAPPPEVMVQGGSSVARVWNNYGSLLTLIAGNLGIEPEVIVATLAVESGGRSAGADGRLLIRFENHIFRQHWADARFGDHFLFDPAKTWQGHHWRPTINDVFRACHMGDQPGEWEVFDFACSLDDNAAKASISMGLTQVMGFNHGTLGYGTPAAMFDAFSRGPRYQVIGFADFVLKNGAVPALQQGDYSTFARIYNGSGQIALYSRLIRDAVVEIRALRGL